MIYTIKWFQTHFWKKNTCSFQFLSLDYWYFGTGNPCDKKSLTKFMHLTQELIMKKK